ncbi:hypothetical protein BKA70DRAFT_1128836, partial [Coprinopsis sp. MPI-PUGE-AT-0042]
ADIIRDMMLINVSGLEGHSMGIDLNIEHLINTLKAIFSAKGIYGHWERCGNISASIHNIMSLKKQVSRSLNLTYQGTTHTASDSSEVVERMMSAAKDQQLHVKIPGRKAKLRPDLRAEGRRKMETSGLANFNKKVEEARNGIATDPEEDELPAPDLEPIQDPDVEGLENVL